MKILVTGGAGFIGSFVVSSLLKLGYEVICVDDLTRGNLDNIRDAFFSPNFQFVERSICDIKGVAAAVDLSSVKAIWHLAANSDIRAGAKRLYLDLQQNFLSTCAVLCIMREYGIKRMLFASTSAVYGDLSGNLTETSAPLNPVSYYGASKLSAESYISAYSHINGIDALVLRFPNVTGSRLTHGVVYDFINQLEKHPKKLTVLGDGEQNKPYITAEELVETMIYFWDKELKGFTIFNISPPDTLRVKEIANMVIEEMGIKPKVVYSGGSVGWVGDVKTFRYDTSKANAMGWRSKLNSRQAMKAGITGELKWRKRER